MHVVCTSVLTLQMSLVLQSLISMHVQRKVKEVHSVLDNQFHPEEGYAPPLLFHITHIHNALAIFCRYKSEHNQSVVASLTDQLRTFSAGEQGAANIKGTLTRSCY